ncbi:alpha/beta hydrolase [Streptomyces sp. NPDC055059]
MTTRLNRRRFLAAASAAGAATVATPGTALASGAGRTGTGARTADLVGVQAADGTSVIAQHVLDSHTLDITIDSVALGQTASVRVILPKRFGTRPGASWPVLYLLHGGFGNYCDWTRESDIAALTRGRDVLVVMPDGGRLGFYTDWWAHGGSKPGWETFHMVELAQIVERGLRAGDRRAIAGLSMGGFGAVSYAGRHPGYFRAAASFSGTLDTLHPTAAPVYQGPFANWLLEANYTPSGYDPLALFGDPTAQRDVWAAHNPLDLLAQLCGTKLFVSCGDGRLGPLDPPGTDPSATAVRYEAAQALQNREFIARATGAGLDITTDTYSGSHSWPYWARELKRAFPFLLRELGAH